MSNLKLVLKLAFRNVILNRWKNTLAMISIVAGFMSVNLFEGYMRGARELFEESYVERMFYGDFLIHNRDAYNDTVFFDAKNYIAKADQEALIRELQGRRDVFAWNRAVSFSGMLSNGDANTQVRGVGFDVAAAEKIRGEKWGWNASSGRPLKGGTEAMIGEELGELLNCKRSEKIEYLRPQGGYLPAFRQMDCPRSEMQLNSNTDAGQANAVFLNVVGTSNILYRELDSRYVMVSLDVAQRLLDTEGISLLCVRLKKGEDKKKFLTEMRQFIASNNLPLLIDSWKDNAFGDIYRQSMSFLNVLRVFFLIVILTIVLFSILATQNRLVFERIKEIATLRSLGFKHRLITHIFLGEALILALMGSVAGSVLSVVASFITRSIGVFYRIGILSEEVPFYFSLSGPIFLRSALVLLALSLIACYLPVRRAMGLSISEAFSET